MYLLEKEGPVSNELRIYKGRTNIVPVELGIDVSNDTITGEIRVDRDMTSTLLATWDIEFETDGTDGKLIMTIDDSQLQNITVKRGYTDLKRVSGGEPLPVFDSPIRVQFKDSVTA